MTPRSQQREIIRNDRLSLEKRTFLYQFSGAEKYRGGLNDLKEIFPHLLVNYVKLKKVENTIEFAWLKQCR